jgi:DNA processing protein
MSLPVRGDRGLPCLTCVRRSWLLSMLLGHFERLRHGKRCNVMGLLAFSDEQLIDIAGERREQLGRAWTDFDAAAERERCRAAGVEALCRHDSRYPRRLRDAPGPPAVLHVVGGSSRLLEALKEPVVAIVGARRASDYGLEMASAIARGLAAARVTVVSGMALGIDTAAHEGALAGEGTTLAVLAGRPDIAAPASNRGLHRRIAKSGAVLSETAPGGEVRRWSFLARNRLVAALADLVLVVEAGEYSGSLVTAQQAQLMKRKVAAVPGRVTSPLAAGPHSLLVGGASLVRNAQEVLDLVCGPDQRRLLPSSHPDLEPSLAALLNDVAIGNDRAASLIAAGRTPQDVMTGLAELELLGRLRRSLDGRYTPTA